MIRQSVNLLVNGVAWLRKNRRVSLPSDFGPTRVNIGSGLSVAPGWIHVDGSLHILLSGWPQPVLKNVYRLSESRQWYSYQNYIRILKGHTFFHHHLKYGLPFPDRAVDALYTSHFLEHLSQDNGRRLLREAYRVLKPGGKIRVCVPDLEKVILLYQTGRKEQAMEYFFVPGLGDALDRHRYMYDYELLKKSLESEGFTRVVRWDFRKGTMPDIEILDNRPEETLFVEAERPRTAALEEKLIRI